MANRRFGGAPPQKLGGFAQQNFQGNKMSPWQGGAAPSNAGNSGLLSQLSTPQQLALALTNLLQNQPPQNNNPPSLLSLPTTPGYNNQDNFGSDNRFSRGRDFRRPDPYSKNLTGRWRDNSTRPTGTFGSGGGGGGRSSSGRSNSRSNFGSKDRKSPLRGGKGKNDGKNQAGKGNKAPRANDSSKLQQKDGDISNDTSRNEEHDKQAEDDESKEFMGDDSGTGDCIDLSEEKEGGTDDKKEKKPREGRYHGVPPNLLHCFVCNKSMWDGESFQNHIRGKAHKQMMDSLGQSFQITVNILRENMRLVEEKKMIELERMNRNSRNFHRHQQEQTSHCNMCDLKFLGKIIAHRKTEGHQRLKRFLHPKCHYCSQEFPSRMEWVDHRFTPDHLRKIKEFLDARTGEEEGAPLEEQETEMDNDPLLDESLQTEDENPILELTDDLKDLHNRIPAYKPTRPIATSSVQPSSGFYCDICIRFMSTETAAKEHLKTERHYQAFVDAAKRQYKRMTDEEKEKEESKKRRKAEEDAEGDEDAKKLKTEDTNGDEMYDPEEACQDNDTSENAPLDEEFAEVDRLIKTVSEDEKSNANVKEDPAAACEEEEDKKTQGTPSNRGRRGGGAVRNGAGPRSKTRRGGK